MLITFYVDECSFFLELFKTSNEGESYETIKKKNRKKGFLVKSIYTLIRIWVIHMVHKLDKSQFIRNNFWEIWYLGLKKILFDKDYFPGMVPVYEGNN